MSSVKTIMIMSKYCLNTRFIKSMKAAGALHRRYAHPKDLDDRAEGLTDLLFLFSESSLETACKFRGKKKFNSRRMETQILWKLKAEICVAFPKCKLFEDSYTWIYICQTEERLEPMVSCKIVTWTRPIEVRFKLNSDGSFLRNNQRAGIGGVIRNAKGALVMAYCWKLEVLMNDTMNESS
ncbi:hypothetical protein T459_28408 [Capsicum annuum]|uniref:Uncharacterized protein n=1 Tax=Capsicum annuum TaxID=4072 RepID=A0A2G2YH69_CAPAN|nr:hypothetical protein T459_28408 [Capsicum annuum]